jgi:hypothetical protein
VGGAMPAGPDPSRRWEGRPSAGGERAFVLGDPHGGVHVKPGMRPRQHPRGLVCIEAFALRASSAAPTRGQRW